MLDEKTIEKVCDADRHTKSPIDSGRTDYTDYELILYCTACLFLEDEKNRRRGQLVSELK